MSSLSITLVIFFFFQVLEVRSAFFHSYSKINSRANSLKLASFFMLPCYRISDKTRKFCLYNWQLPIILLCGSPVTALWQHTSGIERQQKPLPWFLCSVGLSLVPHALIIELSLAILWPPCWAGVARTLRPATTPALHSLSSHRPAASCRHTMCRPNP